VFGTTSSAEKAELAKSKGADHVFVYTQKTYKEIVEEIKKITGGEGIEAGVDAVFDGVGKDTFDDSLEVLKRLG
jgi:NADPH:quinone reductase